MWLWLALALGAMPLVFITVETPHLWILGLRTADFVSADYFPLLPWIFIFLFGASLGGRIKERRLPERFYGLACPPLEAVGRHSLLIYLLHQPVLMGLSYGLYWLFA